jgi:hypothetical protein
MNHDASPLKSNKDDDLWAREPAVVLPSVASYSTFSISYAAGSCGAEHENVFVS